MWHHIKLYRQPLVQLMHRAESCVEQAAFSSGNSGKDSLSLQTSRPLKISLKAEGCGPPQGELTSGQKI